MEESIEKIHSVVTGTDRSADLESLTEQISTLSLNYKDLSVVIDKLLSNSPELRQLASLSEIYSKADNILQTIDYEQRSARHDSIPEAYTTTFQWVFDKQSLLNNHLLKWLEKGNEIFWITGKPGAGKSTLIKFVADSPETKTGLRKWAGKSKPVISCHYFWSTGMPIQRSRDDLLRFLLFDIFCEAPELFPETCPRRWNKAFSSSSVICLAWSSSELSQTILAVLKKGEASLNFCFFNDGLDEAYLEENGDELCDTIMDLSTYPNVKLCISSGPWNRFTEYFGSRPTDHEHTRVHSQ